jgi:hypothetical protein
VWQRTAIQKVLSTIGPSVMASIVTTTFRNAD